MTPYITVRPRAFRLSDLEIRAPSILSHDTRPPPEVSMPLPPAEPYRWTGPLLDWMEDYAAPEDRPRVAALRLAKMPAALGQVLDDECRRVCVRAHRRYADSPALELAERLLTRCLTGGAPPMAEWAPLLEADGDAHWVALYAGGRGPSWWKWGAAWATVWNGLERDFGADAQPVVRELLDVLERGRAADT